MRFLDTNVLVYTLAADRRGEIARSLLIDGGVIAVQCLNEFTDVARRKLKMSWSDIGLGIEQLLLSCTLFEPVTAEVQANGRRLAERLKLRIFDAVLLAIALEAGCDIFISEDLQDGLLVNGLLKVSNPFAGIENAAS